MKKRKIIMKPSDHKSLMKMMKRSDCGLRKKLLDDLVVQTGGQGLPGSVNALQSLFAGQGGR